MDKAENSHNLCLLVKNDGVVLHFLLKEVFFVFSMIIIYFC